MTRNAIIGLLLLGASVTAVLWVVSYAVVNEDFAAYAITKNGVTFDVVRCREWGLGCGFMEGSVNTLLTTSLDATEAVEERYHRLGSFRFHAFPQVFRPEGRFLIRSLEVPLWFLFVLFALYPAIALTRGPLRRRRRRKRNQCVHCGYNLTGLPEPTCPKCGEPT